MLLINYRLQKITDIKKSELNDLAELSEAEKRRYDEIVKIQTYLTQGYSPKTIKDLLHTSYKRIRRYAKGDPYKMCRFIINNSDTRRTVNTPKYREQIIPLLEQNMAIYKVHNQIVEIGGNARLTAFRGYCHRLIDELGIKYTSQKNSAGICIRKDQTVNVHYVSKKDVFKFIWSGKETNENDMIYIFKKYPMLEDIGYAIYDFRDIYAGKDTRLLDTFISKYLKSSITSIKSFANGLKLDIKAVKNSIVSDLSNGFVEGQNNKIKLIKRTMYGRAKMPLLRAKILLAP